MKTFEQLTAEIIDIETSLAALDIRAAARAAQANDDHDQRIALQPALDALKLELYENFKVAAVAPGVTSYADAGAALDALSTQS